jgi:hypothetical protein
MQMDPLGFSDEAALALDEQEGENASSLIAAEFFGKGDMPLSAIRTEDLSHPQTVAGRLAQGDAAFEAELAGDRKGLHAEAQAKFIAARAEHDRLIHKAWLIARRAD